MTNSLAGGGKISRRGFLKATGAAGVLAAVGTGSMGMTALAASAPPTSEDRICDEGCFTNCPAQNCGMKVHVRDGKVVKVTHKTDVEIPAEMEGKYEYDRRPCLRGRSHIQWIYHPDRIQYPMRRVGERGSGQWERITWEEAIAEIGEKFNSYRAEFGPQSIAMPYMTGSYGCIQGLNGVWTRFSNVAECTHMDFSLDNGWAVGEQRVVGSGFGSNNSFWDCVNSKHIFVWGANLTDTLIQSWHWVPKAQEKGATVICIDPRYSVTASKADIFVPINVGTDSALMMAMIRQLIEGGLYDEEYVKAHTVAPFLVREDNGQFLRMSDFGVEPVEGPLDRTGKPTIIDPAVVLDAVTGQRMSEKECSDPVYEGSFDVDGFKVTTAFTLLRDRVQPYTPEWAAPKTGIDAEMIVRLAEMYADGPTTFWTCYGFDRYDNSDSLGHAATTICALTGNLGVNGGGFGLTGTAAGPMLFLDPAYTNPSKAVSSKVPWICLQNVVETNMHGDQPYTIKALLNVCGNPFANHAQMSEFLEKTLPKIDFVVTHDMRMTDTARYSDLVLPAAHWWEDYDLTSSTWLQMNDKAIDPLYESKSNVEFFTLVAQAIGLGEFFTQTAQEACEAAVNEYPLLKMQGITYDMLKEKGSIFNINPVNYDGLKTHDFKFSTPSGRLEFYCENPQPRVNYGQEYDPVPLRLPDYTEPLEVNEGNPLREKYPLAVLQEHSKWRVHTSFGDLPWLRELDPEPTVKISIGDASARGIQAGEMVRVFNDRGHVVLKAVVDGSLPVGVCNIPKGWEKWQTVEGSYQDLTSRQLNPVTLNQTFNDILVEIEKA